MAAICALGNAPAPLALVAPGATGILMERGVADPVPARAGGVLGGLVSHQKVR